MISPMIIILYNNAYFSIIILFKTRIIHLLATLPCDEFQSKAFHATENDKHVLVTAHTGSGKNCYKNLPIDYFTNIDRK